MTGAVAMAIEGERLAALEAEHRAHVKSDDERYDSILANSQQTLTEIKDLGRKIERGFERAHKRIDEETAAAMAKAGAAHARISSLKVWWLSGAAALLLAVVVFFVAPFFSGNPPISAATERGP